MRGREREKRERERERERREREKKEEVAERKKKQGKKGKKMPPNAEDSLLDSVTSRALIHHFFRAIFNSKHFKGFDWAGKGIAIQERRASASPRTCQS